MKPEAQLIAIGKHLGLLNPRIDEAGTLVSSIGIDRHGQYWGSMGHPDYLNDLNAIRAAAATFSFSQRQKFKTNLQWVMSKELKLGRLVEMGECLFATAAQWAEAFLKTIGKWEEEA